VNKHKTEEIINNMLLTLQHQYCRIQMVKEVYTTARMKEHIAVVYRLGIEFLYEAIRYYSTGGFHRFWRVMAQPPNIQLTDKVTEIQTAIEEIRKEMEVLDGIRLNTVENKVQEVIETTREIEQSVEGG
jgi:hypothetical protein